MKKFSNILFTIILSFFITGNVLADVVIDNGLNYLKSKQDVDGKITGGSRGDASPWATIAFSANEMGITAIQNPTNSLKDYLLNNHPNTASIATEWEKWILAITSSGFNPYDFGGVNYISTLKSCIYYNNNQIGDNDSVNDDWFGVLALISSGVSNSDPVLTDSLNFILAHQNTDGGYGYSTTADSDSNDTASAIQALVAAKNHNVINIGLDNAITKAKTYLLNTQDSNGGFLYDTNPWTTAPDSDSTTWALMALNVLGMQDSDQANSARTWLLSQQSISDGGFTSCSQWDPITYACTGYTSNSTTTSDALVGLAKKGWVVNIFDPSTITITPTPTLIQYITPTPTISITPTMTPTSTPTATPTLTSAPAATATPQPTSTPTPTLTPTPTSSVIISIKANPTPTETQVHGAQTSETKPVDEQPKKKSLILTFVFIGLGILSLIIHKGII